MNDKDNLEVLREKILTASLPHIPFDGWTMKALKRGAADCGFDDASALRAFPVSAIDAIEYHSQLADRHMIEKASELPDLPVRKRIAKVIECRLKQQIPHREAIRRACSVLILPTNAAMAARSLYNTVDTIWYIAGDRSTDWNFYSKRMLLAGIYSSTLLYWLDDNSHETKETFDFLDRRIDNVMQVPKIKDKITNFILRLSNSPRNFRL